MHLAAPLTKEDFVILAPKGKIGKITTGDGNYRS